MPEALPSAGNWSYQLDGILRCSGLHAGGANAIFVQKMTRRGRQSHARLSGPASARLAAPCLALLLFAGVASTAACGRRAEADARGAIASAAPRVEARDVFAERCAPCHGAGGRGDGAAAAECNPRPPDLSDRQRQARLSDDDLRRLILRGGKATGRSNVMPPNEDLATHADQLAALVAKVRSLAAR